MSSVIDKKDLKVVMELGTNISLVPYGDKSNLYVTFMFSQFKDGTIARVYSGETWGVDKKEHTVRDMDFDHMLSIEEMTAVTQASLHIYNNL